MKRITTIVAAACLFISLEASAQPARNAAERSQDHQNVRQDGRQVEDDRRDLHQLTNLLYRFDQARAVRDIRGLDLVDQDLRVLLSREVNESRVELSQARNEAAQSNSEVRSDRRELGRDAATGAAPGVAANDRHDIRDDRRDRADDQADLNQEKRQTQRRVAIARELELLYGRHDPAAQSQKRALMVELIEIARVEVRQGQQETKEDQRELREDRRETREDIRRP